jgi:quinol monooxygenase YgiN
MYLKEYAVTAKGVILSVGKYCVRTSQQKEEASMYIVHVFIRVKPDVVENFKAVTLENAVNSLKEPGVVRFDVVQEIEDPTRFVLMEIYRTKNDAVLHKETSHYNRWREIAEPLMAEPRSRIFYQNIHPTDSGWQ